MLTLTITLTDPGLLQSPDVATVMLSHYTLNKSVHIVGIAGNWNRAPSLPQELKKASFSDSNDDTGILNLIQKLRLAVAASEPPPPPPCHHEAMTT